MDTGSNLLRHPSFALWILGAKPGAGNEPYAAPHSDCERRLGGDVGWARGLSLAFDAVPLPIEPEPLRKRGGAGLTYNKYLPIDIRTLSS